MVNQGYRIYRKEEFHAAYKRLIREQLKLCVDFCQHYGSDPDVATHEIRKSIKRIRAVCRLYEAVTDVSEYMHQHEKYRKISSLLAEHRLSAVYCSTLALAGLKVHPNPDWLTGLSLNLHARHGHITASLMERQVPEEVHQLLLQAEEALENQTMAHCTITHLVKGLWNSYKNGRNQLDIARYQPSTHNLHELRKSVKNLWNQLILFRPVWPSVMGMSIHNLDILAERLGNDHDLAELEIFLNMIKAAGDPNQDALTQLIHNRRKQIQKLIFPLASRIFAEKPGAFKGRMLTYYRIFAQHYQ